MYPLKYLGQYFCAIYTVGWLDKISEDQIMSNFILLIPLPWSGSKANIQVTIPNVVVQKLNCFRIPADQEIRAK